MRRESPHPSLAIELAGAASSPLRKIGFRLLLALGLILFVALISYEGRDGYFDPEDDEVSLLDAFYYSTVSITTTGYGDIRPVSDEARLVTTLLVTPARILFLILLVGTTLEILAERSRHAFRVARWRRNLTEHTIVCGYGTKGRMAVTTIRRKGTDPKQIVVIDQRADARRRANDDGIAAVDGNASDQHTLELAGCADAASVIVAVDRDDAAVLITLTARELNPRATIVASVREEENVHLLYQSGASGVVTSSGAAGRLLGLSTETPQVTDVLEDLMSVGQGLDIAERDVLPGEAGPVAGPAAAMTLAVIRDGEMLRFDDPRASELRPGDRLIELVSHRTETA